MYYLLLSIIFSAFVSITMRLSDKHIRNNMTMFLSNYAACILLAILFGLRVNTSAFSEGVIFPIGMGLISGIMYLVNFILLQVNINRNGIVLSTTFMKLGVIVPTIMAVVVFHETLTLTSIAGICLALISVVIINQNPNEVKNQNVSYQFSLLLILLAAGGFTDSLANIYDKCGSASLKDLYLLCTFLFAFLCSLIIKTYKKQRFTFADLGWGALIGIPNYFSARFLLLSLSQMPATIVYPVYNIGTIVFVTITGMIFFKERLSLNKWIAMGIIFLALFLLSI